MKLLACGLALVMSLALASDALAAKRLGGGQSVGKQSSNVTKREAPPANNANAPAQSTANAAPGAATPATAAAAKPATPAPAAQQAAPKKPWGAMLGGLAAGLGLAWLAHSLGFGEAFGQMLMFGLLALAIMVAVGWFMRRRQAGAAQGATSGAPYAFGTAGAGAGALTPSPNNYRPENVGNDASARPFERQSIQGELEPVTTSGRAGGIVIGSALGSSSSGRWMIPEGFDTPGFLTAAKANFVSLQAAWDRSDIPGLRVMMTDEMLKEMQVQLRERDMHTGGKVNQTDVVMLDAQLLGIEDLGDDYMASVEFSGMIREEPSAGPSPFREVWNMTKPKNGTSGWLVAGVQALQ